MTFASVPALIQAIKQGSMVVLVDDADRENEGDLVIAAAAADARAITFMAVHGRGLICLALCRQRVQQLQLDMQPCRHASRHQTAFTVSIEARAGVTTGISAADRAQTVAVAIDPAQDASAIATPGHVFPIVAQNGGVLARPGHTEASVDLARMAGHLPAGVICEIMGDDGKMARLPDLMCFAKKHGLLLGSIADIVAYLSCNGCKDMLGDCS